jgi:hypothetical protein
VTFRSTFVVFRRHVGTGLRFGQVTAFQAHEEINARRTGKAVGVAVQDFRRAVVTTAPRDHVLHTILRTLKDTRPAAVVVVIIEAIGTVVTGKALTVQVFTFTRFEIDAIGITGCFSARSLALARGLGDTRLPLQQQ